MDATGTGPATVSVWLAEWQAAEDHLDVHAGQVVTWTLTDETEWADLLFGGTRTVDLVLDTYADPGHSPAPTLVEVSGLVRSVEAVTCRRLVGGDAEPGSATATAVQSTLDALAFGPRSSLEPEGFVITLERSAS